MSGAATGALIQLLDLPLPAEKKELAFLCYQKEAAEFDLVPLVLKKICTDHLSRLTAYPNGISAPSHLVFDLCYVSVESPTKPLTFCREELIGVLGNTLCFIPGVLYFGHSLSGTNHRKTEYVL